MKLRCTSIILIAGCFLSSVLSQAVHTFKITNKSEYEAALIRINYQGSCVEDQKKELFPQQTVSFTVNDHCQLIRMQAYMKTQPAIFDKMLNAYITSNATQSADFSLVDYVKGSTEEMYSNLLIAGDPQSGFRIEHVPQ